MSICIRTLVIVCFSLIIASCAGTKEYHPSEQEKSIATEQSKTIIQDQNAIMPSWYRRALQPSYSISVRIVEQNWPKPNLHYQTAIPSPALTPFFVILAISTTIFYAIALRIMFVKSPHDDANWFIAILVTGAYVVAAGLIGFGCKIIVHFLYTDPDTYIPWHFATCIGLLLPVVILVFAAIRDWMEQVSKRAWYERMLISIAGGLVSSSVLYLIGVGEGIKLITVAIVGILYITVSIAGG